MNDGRPRPSSRILSWIAGSALKEDESVVGQPRRNRSSSLRSFIPSIRNASKAEHSFLSLSRSVSNGQRPEPFFYPKPLDREQGPEDEYSFVTATEEVSISSLTSTEIALWKKQRASVESSPTRIARKRNFSGLSSLLIRKKAGGKFPPPQTPKDGTLPELPLEDSFVECKIEDTEEFIATDHLTSLPELTFSSYSQKRSSDIPSLLPPPRSKRESISISADWSLWNKQAKRNSRAISIDAAKWAEISISAADLVRLYGQENVIIQNADEYPSSDLETEDVIPVHAQESFMEMDEEFHSPQLSPQSKSDSMAHQEIHVGGSSVVSGSSFVGSMASFSKWPLPPQCEQFGMEKVIT